MTKRERVLAAVTCAETDRVPFSLWYHFRLDPPAGPNMAAAELDFHRRCSPDLLKVMHDIPYEMPAGLPVVEQVEEWARLPVLDGVSGNFGAQLATVRQIIAERGDDAPVIDTVFGVHSTANKICGGRVLEMLRQDPDAVAAGLRSVAASLANYAAALVTAGADGIYLAVSGAAADTMPADEYRRHFLAYDQQVLEAAAGAAATVVHHHGGGIYPDLVLGLSGWQIYSWSNRLPRNPSIREMRLRTRACLMSGVDETTFGTATVEAIQADARAALAETNGLGFILAPGCAVPTPPDTPEANLQALRSVVGG